MIVNSTRLEKVKAYAIEKGTNPPEDTFEYDRHYAAKNKYQVLELWEKIARSTAEAIMAQQVYIEPFDQIIGRTYYNGKKPEYRDSDLDTKREAQERMRCEFEEYDEFQKYQLVGNTGRGHIAWDWDRMLKLGTDGMRKRCYEELLRKTDSKSQEFYHGVLIMLDAVDGWNEKHIQKLEEMGMREQAQICRQVPRYPARTFREAVQAFFFQYIIVMKENPYGGNAPGRLDYYLWPYLERDIQNGICTYEEAKELIDELFLRINERIHMDDTWNENVTIGGSHIDGTSAVNPLSYMMIESIMELNITHPLIYVRIPKNPPEEFVDLTTRYLLKGGNLALLMNDDVVIQSLTEHGILLQDAVNYCTGGCLELGIQGKTGDFLANGWHNITKMVELAVNDGRCLVSGEKVKGFHIRKLEDYTDFSSFYADFIKEVRRILNMFFTAQDYYSEVAENASPAYLISSMVDDCMEKGRGMHGGGVKYFDYGSVVVGIPNAADYLFAVKKAIYEWKICTPSELRQALAMNFQGYEELRRCLRKIPKYGQGNEEADTMVRDLASDISDIYYSYVNRYGGRGRLSVLNFIWGVEASKIMGATADGNFAGALIAQGITPQSSSMNEGITTAIHSCTTVPHTIFSNGATTMWDFESSWIQEEVLKAIFMTFFQKGGMTFMGNIIDEQTLLDAKIHPDKYPNLFVKVGGFSARYINLSQEIQNDIIERIRHAQ